MDIYAGYDILVETGFWLALTTSSTHSSSLYKNKLCIGDGWLNRRKHTGVRRAQASLQAQSQARPRPSQGRDLDARQAPSRQHRGTRASKRRVWNSQHCLVLEGNAVRRTTCKSSGPPHPKVVPFT